MLPYQRIKNQIIAKLATRFPSIAKRYTKSFTPLETEGIPWIPIQKPQSESKIAIITTAGVHHRDQKPFNMLDTDGDPSFRAIDSTRPINELMITHDYYDHSDADKDINIVFPIQRLFEFENESIIGKVAKNHYGFIGHILGNHIQTLINKYVPDVIERLKASQVDIVILTPG